MAPIRIQTARGTWSSGSSFTVTLSPSPVDGDALVLTFASTGGTSNGVVTSITQTGATWSVVKALGGTGGSFGDCEIWIAPRVSSAGSTITVNVTAPVGVNKYAVANVCEYSGITASIAVDRTASNTGANNSGPTDTGTTATTTVAVELLVGSISVYGGTQSSPTNGFTLIDGALTGTGTGVDGSGAYLEKIVSSTGAANSGTSRTGSGDWIGCIATFVSSAVVQTKTADWTSGSTISLTLTSTPTNGNALIAVIGVWQDVTNSPINVSNITQTGASWAKAVDEQFAFGATPGTTKDEIWYALNISGASTSITVNLSGTPTSGRGAVALAEYGGLGTEALDKTASNTGSSGTALDSGTTSTTTQASELWVAGFIIPSPSFTYSAPTNGFLITAQIADGTGNCAAGICDKLVTSTGAANTGVTVGASTAWGGTIATFKAFIRLGLPVKNVAVGNPLIF